MLLKKVMILGAGILLTLGMTSSSYAWEHWHTRHVSVKCAGGICHKHIRTWNKKCVGGNCRVWRNNYHWSWRR